MAIKKVLLEVFGFAAAILGAIALLFEIPILISGGDQTGKGLLMLGIFAAGVVLITLGIFCIRQSVKK